MYNITGQAGLLWSCGGRSRSRTFRTSSSEAMNATRLAFATLGYLVGCAHASQLATAPAYPPCPTGFAPNLQRAHHLASLLAYAGASEASVLTGRLCFGPSTTLGVLAGGQPFMDAHAPDEALAARLAHLHVHVRDGLGDGCTAGLAQALLSEQNGSEQERRLRVVFGLATDLQETPNASVDYIQRCTE
jgi:hypothetical protein